MFTDVRGEGKKEEDASATNLSSQSILVSGFLVLSRDRGRGRDHKKINKSQFLETCKHSCSLACSNTVQETG